MNRLFVNLRETPQNEIVGQIKFSTDSVFTVEALLTVIEDFAKQLDRPTSSVIQDLYGYQLHKERLTKDAQQG